MLIAGAFLYITFRVPNKGAPSSRLPSQRALRKISSVSRALLQLSLTVSDERTPLIIHLSLKVPGNSATLHVLQQGPCGYRCSISRANGLFIHLYPSESPFMEPFHENGKNIRSRFTVPHVDRRPTYRGVLPGSPKESIDTAITTPVPCSLQHDTFHLGLVRPEPR
jgi:hypothetical protein